MRTFIAVDLPADIKTAISAFLQKIKRTAPGGIGWANPADMHITLKFLGEIDEADVDPIGETVRKIAAETTAFSLAVAGTGTFPPGSARPRVLWIGIEESPALKALQSRLEEALEPLGFAREDRPFQPHLTAARIRSSGIPSRIIEPFAENTAVAFGSFPVREILLYQSILRPNGAEHRRLVSGALQP